MNKKRRFMRQLGILVLCMMFFSGLTACGQSQSNQQPASLNENLSDENAMDEDGLYKDGIYEGAGKGYSRGLKVSVAVENGLITDIEITAHNEVGEQYYKSAFEQVPKRIVENQTTDVDVVSGATMTSNGIKQAVNNALSGAIKR